MYRAIIGPRTSRNLLVLFALCSGYLAAQLNVATQGYDGFRSGANLAETQLTASNVSGALFGKLWTYPVSGSVFAQPLYISNVAIPGQGTRNVLYVVTMNDVVYAFDADSASATPLWFVDLTSEVTGSTPVPIADIVQNNSLNIVGNVGIEGTPVIDVNGGTMYLVARTKENGQYFQRLHALDITTGAETLGGPVVIGGSVAGTGTGSSGGFVTFNPLIQDQRPGLALSNGQVIVAWSSHEDLNPYHGWVMSYDASNLQQTGIFCDSPNGSQGGIWMSGRAPAIDASGNVYFMTGNGTWDGITEFGESFLKFSTDGLTLLDWFTPNNYATLNASDIDLGASGPMILPGANMVLGGGKEGLFYLLDNGTLGHMNGTNAQILESFTNGGSEIHAGPVYWNRSGGAAPWMYVWADTADTLNAYRFNGAGFDSAPIAQSLVRAASGDSGGVLALSANGSAPGTGIIWSSMPATDDGDFGVHAGVLRAVNAENLTELWNSNQNAARDGTGNWPKFSAPVVANGRVYLGGYPSDGVSNTSVSVFGLLGAPFFTLSPASASLTVPQGGNGSDLVTINNVNGFAGTVNLTVSGLPGGVTASYFSAPSAATFTFAASSGAVPGTYPVTIAGSSGSLNAIATIALTIGSGTCQANAITPYMRVGNSDWVQTASVNVPSGSKVGIGPQPLNGTWSWTGPGGFTSSQREIDNIPLVAGTNTFTATYTDPGACVSTQNFVVVVAAPVPGFTVTPATPNLPIIPGRSATETIAVTALNGFTGAVTLSASGLPGGVTASFSPNPASGPSVLTLTASSLAIVGPATVTITGASGSIASSATLSLNVTTSCVAAPITPFIRVGTADWLQTASVTVPSGLPVGLGPQPTGGSWSWAGPGGFTSTAREIDNIPLNPGGNIFVATYTDQSSCSATGTFLVNVPAAAPAFALTPSARNLSVTQGGSASDTISVTPLSGFSGSVSFSVSGLPAGVSASFSPNPSVRPSRLTLNAASSTPPGNYTITVNGTSGSISASTPLALTVGAASCTPTPLTPYVRVGSADWQQTANATVGSASGSSVGLGPQPLDGTWIWNGPAGFNSGLREIDNIPLSLGTNTFVATYTNPSGCQSSQTFVITAALP